MAKSLSIRTYDEPGTLHTHDFIQVVLPMSGTLDIEVEGRGARLSQNFCAFITPEELHTQDGLKGNSCLVLDAPFSAFPKENLATLERKVFFEAPIGMQRLIEFTALRSQNSALLKEDFNSLAHLLIGAFGMSTHPRSMLEKLSSAIYCDLRFDWSVGRMAAKINVSRSVLYRLIAKEKDETPGHFLIGIRLRAARAAIINNNQSIANIAYDCGFSDQSSLTRAMQREMGETPGSLRQRTRNFRYIKQNSG